MKKIFFALLMTVVITSCGNKQENSESTSAATGFGDDTIEVSECVDSVVVESPDKSSDKEEPSVSSASSNNWDSVLDEYEKYCNKLASLSKKAMAGDMAVMAEYTSTLEQAQKLSDKLEHAEGEMTPAQVSRLNKIAAKMAQSVM